MLASELELFTELEKPTGALRTGASYAALYTGIEIRLGVVGVDFVKTNKKVMVGPKE